MAKKIKFESFKYRFLTAAHQLRCKPLSELSPSWQDFINELDFVYHAGTISVRWDTGVPGGLKFSLGEPKLHLRGDSDKRVARQRELYPDLAEDAVKINNDSYFRKVSLDVARQAGYIVSELSKTDLRIENEREFHDAWAESEKVENIGVRASNEVCTAPEMRFITQRLGNLQGKRLLDVGCGLGEASVYFAILGADVTSSDLSQGMLDASGRLAKANNVEILLHLASAEDMRLSSADKFDIIYMGNLLHHVDIEQTIKRIKPHLAPGGVFVSWDPIAYNPIINVYRSMATDVRTPDEHPFRWSDLKLFRKHFSCVETRYFWFTTLIIFVLMALAQQRNPNKERYWKAVVKEGDKWRWLYLPLEFLDRILLALIPPLRLLCWNVVVISKP